MPGNSDEPCEILQDHEGKRRFFAEMIFQMGFNVALTLSFILLPLLSVPLAVPLVRTVGTRGDGPSLNAALAGTGKLLAIYSIPLRQGLNHYAQQTIRGFLEAGAASLRLRAPEVNELESTLLSDAPAIIERALAEDGPGHAQRPARGRHVVHSE